MPLPHVRFDPRNPSFPRDLTVEEYFGIRHWYPLTLGYDSSWFDHTVLVLRPETGRIVRAFGPQASETVIKNWVAIYVPLVLREMRFYRWVEPDIYNRIDRILTAGSNRYVTVSQEDLQVQLDNWYRTCNPEEPS